MKPNRLPVKIYNWEESLNINGWVKDLKHILTYCNMSEYGELDTLCDLDVASKQDSNILIEINGGWKPTTCLNSELSSKSMI